MFGYSVQNNNRNPFLGLTEEQGPRHASNPQQSLHELEKSIIEPDKIEDVSDTVTEKNDIPGKVNSKSSLQGSFVITMGLFSLVLFFWLVSLATLIVTMHSCREDSILCLPQISFQLSSETPIARALLVKAEQALRLISYIAVDLGAHPSEDGNVFVNPHLREMAIKKNMQNPTEFNSVFNYLKTVDTLTTDNIFRLNFFGYCKDQLAKGSTVCKNEWGLDFVSVLLRDAGDQLSQITSDPELGRQLVGESFVKAYRGILKQASNLNLQDRKLENAIQLSRVSKIIPLLVFITCISKAVDTVLMIVVMGFYIWKRNGHANIITILLNVVFGIHLITLITGFLSVVLETEYFIKLSAIGEQTGIAVVVLDVGSYVVFASAFANVIVCFLLLITISKRPYS
ncbi:BA75_04808T0 [Komagataella pastoris]|uniref:BA75_04808T0 n=1 Tax=Komagataella pastoris TaxID=4922 RepID=A0A1B2JIP5_PICPA|nr:BA75_04808T0 [Komagataella pastoris]